LASLKSRWKFNYRLLSRWLGLASSYKILGCFALKIMGSEKLKSTMNKKLRPTEQYIQDYRVSIGKQIREFREKKGYSQDDLAEIMEVHRSTISKVETGKFSITIDYLVKFAWYLDFKFAISEGSAKF
jgi:DNA-binding XRE family transcriptional regulator